MKKNTNRIKEIIFYLGSTNAVLSDIFGEGILKPVRKFGDARFFINLFSIILKKGFKNCEQIRKFEK